MSTGPEETDTTAHGWSLPRTTLALVLALLALLAVDRLRTVWREARQETGAARWVWPERPERFTPPRAFYLVRDFDLASLADTAWLSVLGDEEYVLFLNGRAVGSNRYSTDSELDRYEVSSFLRPGRNRVTVHLRSSAGSGAFLAALWVGASDEPLVVTDETWRVAHMRTPPLMNPDQEVRWNDEAVVVAVPPAGRWGPTTRGIDRPLLRDLIAGRREVTARRILLPGRQWSGTTWRRTRREAALGERVVFDFGRPRTGFLWLDFPAGEPALAVVYLGLEPPEPAARPPEITVITRGEERWLDAVPRTFRYAMVVGLEQIRDASILQSDPDAVPPIVAGEPPEGVFGLSVPRLRTPAENVVWSELERFPGDSAW
jgi:hypothetical protein